MQSFKTIFGHHKPKTGQPNQNGADSEPADTIQISQTTNPDGSITTTRTSTKIIKISSNGSPTSVAMGTGRNLDKLLREKLHSSSTDNTNLWFKQSTPSQTPSRENTPTGTLLKSKDFKSKYLPGPDGKPVGPSEIAPVTNQGQKTLINPGKFKSVGIAKASASAGPKAANLEDFTQCYDKLKAELLKTGQTFEDPDFPAVDSSVFYSSAARREILWRRPHEIVSNPRFFIDDASRFDVVQGELGNCWFLAAVADLTMNQNVFHRVVPQDNSFVQDYCGIFHFRFWQCGHWVDVVVDDRLPCNPQGQLVFMHSAEAREFWSALLEKAYAKLYGSYEALIGGKTSEALQDFTGGVVETIDIKEAAGKSVNLFALMEKFEGKESFMGCSIQAHPSITEARLSVGLIRGHAYSITKVLKMPISTGNKTGKIPLLRIRNPWGSVEWKGPWSDGSREWSLIPKNVQEEIGLANRDDGEFWMSYEDWKKFFDLLEIVSLSPEPIAEGSGGDGGKKWTVHLLEGAWVKGCSAGGCTNHISMKEPKTFACNPQFLMEFSLPPESPPGSKVTVLLTLMQKNVRKRKKEGVTCLPIGFCIYEVKDPQSQPQPLNNKYFILHPRAGDSGMFQCSREVTGRFELVPGTYCVIPSTFEPNQEGEFLIRVFTEGDSGFKEYDTEIGLGKTDEKIEEETKKETDSTTDVLSQLFRNIAGADNEIGWEKLKGLLDAYLRAECGYEGFNREICRSMLAMVDKDRSGKLGVSEFTDLWKSILTWKGAFKLYDEDGSGNLSSFELRKALSSAGYLVNNRILQSIVLRYGNEAGNISFEDFIMVSVKLKTLMEVFTDHKIPGQTSESEAKFELGNWIEKMLYA